MNNSSKIEQNQVKGQQQNHSMSSGSKTQKVTQSKKMSMNSSKQSQNSKTQISTSHISTAKGKIDNSSTNKKKDQTIFFDKKGNQSMFNQFQKFSQLNNQLISQKAKGHQNNTHTNHNLSQQIPFNTQINQTSNFIPNNSTFETVYNAANYSTKNQQNYSQTATNLTIQDFNSSNTNFSKDKGIQGLINDFANNPELKTSPTSKIAQFNKQNMGKNNKLNELLKMSFGNIHKNRKFVSDPYQSGNLGNTTMTSEQEKNKIQKQKQQINALPSPQNNNNNNALSMSMSSSSKKQQNKTTFISNNSNAGNLNNTTQIFSHQNNNNTGSSLSGVQNIKPASQNSAAIHLPSSGINTQKIGFKATQKKSSNINDFLELQDNIKNINSSNCNANKIIRQINKGSKNIYANQQIQGSSSGAVSKSGKTKNTINHSSILNQGRNSIQNSHGKNQPSKDQKSAQDQNYNNSNNRRGLSSSMTNEKNQQNADQLNTAAAIIGQAEQKRFSHSNLPSSKSQSFLQQQSNNSNVGNNNNMQQQQQQGRSHNSYSSQIQQQQQPITSWIQVTPQNIILNYMKDLKFINQFKQAMINYVDFVPNIKYPYYFTDPGVENLDKISELNDDISNDIGDQIKLLEYSNSNNDDFEQFLYWKQNMQKQQRQEYAQ